MINLKLKKRENKNKMKRKRGREEGWCMMNHESENPFPPPLPTALLCTTKACLLGGGAHWASSPFLQSSPIPPLFQASLLDSSTHPTPPHPTPKVASLLKLHFLFYIFWSQFYFPLISHFKTQINTLYKIPIKIIKISKS